MFSEAVRLAIVQTVEIFFSKSNASYEEEIILSNRTLTLSNCLDWTYAI